jgi:hypothetical protein
MALFGWRASLRAGDLVAAHRVIAFDQEPVVFGVEDRLIDILAGEGLDRPPGFPEAQARVSGSELAPQTM